MEIFDSSYLTCTFIFSPPFQNMHRASFIREAAISLLSVELYIITIHYSALSIFDVPVTDVGHITDDTHSGNEERECSRA